jgi:hypothetical protein
MAVHADRDDGDTEGVEFIHEDDGSVTARDLETGLARGGDSKADALAQLAEVLALHDGEGEPIDDPDAFLEEIGVDSDTDTDVETPPWESN